MLPDACRLGLPQQPISRHHRRRADFPLFLTTFFFFRLPLLLPSLTPFAGNSPAKKKPPGITRAGLCAIPPNKGALFSMPSLLREVPCLLPKDCHISFSQRSTIDPSVPSPLMAFTIARFLDTTDDLGCPTPKAELTRGRNAAACWRNIKIVHERFGTRTIFC